MMNSRMGMIPGIRLPAHKLQSITSHENSRTSVRLELSGQLPQNISHIINPPVPKRGIEQAFTSLYFLAKQRIANFEPLLDFWKCWEVV